MLTKFVSWQFVQTCRSTSSQLWTAFCALYLSPYMQQICTHAMQKPLCTCMMDYSQGAAHVPALWKSEAKKLPHGLLYHALTRAHPQLLDSQPHHVLILLHITSAWFDACMHECVNTCMLMKWTTLFCMRGASLERLRANDT